MEDALVLENILMNFNKNSEGVLILVLMEDALVLTSGQEYHNPWSES